MSIDGHKGEVLSSRRRAVHNKSKYKRKKKGQKIGQTREEEGEEEGNTSRANAMPQRMNRKDEHEITHCMQCVNKQDEKN